MDTHLIKHLVVNHQGAREVLIIKFSEKELIKSLSKIKSYYEVIIFTIIPKRFFDLIIAMVPQLTEVTNFILTNEDCSETCEEALIVRDVSLFLHNRSRQDIYIIDIIRGAVDTNCLFQFHPKPYDGGIMYPYLDKLDVFMKHERSKMIKNGNWARP